jgi:hypothetical protein
MLEQIKQVCTTYLTQRMFWISAAVIGPVALVCLMSTLGPSHNTNGGWQILSSLGMPFFIVIPFLVGHAKMQFAHSRSRLIPGFFPAHIAVLGSILLLMSVVYPLALAGLNGTEPLGALALSLGMGASMIWAAHRNRFLPALLGLAAFYSLMTPWGMNWWVLQAAEHRGIHAIIAISGLALITAFLWRICHLHEEDDDYQNNYAAVLARRSGSEVVEERRVVAAQVGRNWLTSNIGDWWHSRIGGYYGGGTAGRARVLRYGFSTIPMEVQALFFGAMIIGIGGFFTQLGFSATTGGGVGGIPFVAQFAIVLPGYFGGELMARRRPRIGNEMLLPVSRTQLVNSLFSVSAEASAKVWFVTNVAFGIVAMLSNVEITLSDAALFAVLSAAIAFATFGLSMRTAVWSSMYKRLIVITFTWFILASPIIAWASLHKKWSEVPFLASALALVGVGGALLYFARRKWLDLEFA